MNQGIVQTWRKKTGKKIKFYRYLTFYLGLGKNYKNTFSVNSHSCADIEGVQ